MRKNVLQVYSHQRSGTHLLMEGLSRHFYPNRDLVLQVKNMLYRRYSDGIMELSNQWIRVKGGKLFASHEFPEDCEWSKDNAIYIRRNGFDVLYSFFRLRMSTSNEKQSFDQWLTEDRIRHWVFHVSKWMKTGVYVVRFEDLSVNYEEEMRKIAKRFGFQNPPGGYTKPGLVGWAPGSGKIGQGAKFWSDEKKELLERFKKEFNVS